MLTKYEKQKKIENLLLIEFQLAALVITVIFMPNFIFIYIKHNIKGAYVVYSYCAELKMKRNNK